ncbi:MAG: cytochrome d ubiquinol oxidase subunit II [Actinobacteria bacterium HGW-Actinobacteria-7]|jgi:cytochrome d ubiquinol oxidase subunit II|nr:MAG: cytochrome d ubiquinol oxidase subunit II [Actinobacteria bacterium HGW-Actinobacteria-7]
MGLGELWFVLVGVLLAGYAIFDGFDLGVGTLYPFLGKSEADKAAMRMSIGPIWDGNEVWLLTGGGALFAAFPAVYATVFSGFYIALMLLLFALIFRAGALEFRHVDPAWAKLWDWAFFLGSAIPSLLFGVAVGNIIRGLPLTAEGEFITGGGDPIFLANLVTALNPYAIVIGLLSVAWIVLQGSTWLSLKTTGDLYERAKKTRKVMVVAFGVLLAVSAAATALLVPGAFAKGVASPAGWLFVVLAIAGTVLVAMGAARGADRTSFYGSSLAGASMVGIWAASIFPALVPSIGPGEALTIANSQSSPLTLTVMLIIAGIGVPLVLFYFFVIYKTYAGRIDSSSVTSGHY